MRKLLVFAALFAALGVALAVAAAGDAKKPCRLSNTCPPTTTPTATTPPPTTTTPPPPPPSGSVRASGRSLIDPAGTAVCSPSSPCKGFNFHAIANWSQSHFDDMRAIGAKIGRIIVRWDDFEPTKGAVPTDKALALDNTIARMRQAGLLAIIDFHLISGGYPSWTCACADEDKYRNGGQWLTQWIAGRYGDPASPQYATNVIGFGLNEPPISNNTIRNGPNNVSYLEGLQRTMVSWFRAKAPQWIGFVSYGWSAASPLPGSGTESTVRADLVAADPHAYDSVGGNVVIDIHDYMWGDTRTSPPYDGRQWNGMLYPTWQGGTEIGTGDDGSTYVTSARRVDQQRQYWLPYKTFTTNAQIPLMLGEWGWQTGLTGDQVFLADKRPRWADAGTAIQLYWDYNVCTCPEDPWAARPGGVWRPVVTSWMGN